MQKQEEMAKQNEMQQQQFQANLEMQKEIEAEKLRLEEERNIRDNETKLLIAEMQLEGVQDTNNANAKNAENSSPDQSID
jgi:hypothetical protein